MRACPPAIRRAGTDTRSSPQNALITHQLPQEIVHLDTISRTGKLERKYAEGKADADVLSHISARVTTNVGELSRFGRGALWSVHNGPAGGWKGEITTCVTWTIRGIQAEGLQDWKLVGLVDGEEKAGLKTLRPIGGAIRVFIYNVAPPDLPPLASSHGLAAGLFRGHSGVPTSANRRVVRKGDPADDCAAYFRPIPGRGTSRRTDRTHPRLRQPGRKTPHKKWITAVLRFAGHHHGGMPVCA